MMLEVYNEVYGNLVNFKEYKLFLNMMIIYYYFDIGYVVCIVFVKYGNVKSLDMLDFRFMEYFFKKECK